MTPDGGSILRSDRAASSGTRPEYVYLTRVEHPGEAICIENWLEYFAAVRVPAREIVLHTNGAHRSELVCCLDGSALAVLGMNWHLDHSCIGDRLFLDLAAKANIPVVHWVLDHPSAIWPRMVNTTPDNSCFLFLSPYSRAYFQRFIMPTFRSSWTAGTGPSRHSRISDFDAASFLARGINCILPLNLIRLGGTPDDLEHQMESLPGYLNGAVREAIEAARSDLHNPIEQHFFGNAPPPELLDNARTFHHCIQLIDDIVQMRRRLEVFNIARKFPVLIQSDIAQRYLPDPCQASVEQGVSRKETLARMQQSRAVVSMIHTNDEIHSRVLNALNAGAVNIIEDNVVHRRFFSHGENALFFRYGDNSLNECLDLVCSHPARAFAIAQAGMALRDHPGLRFGGFDNLLALARQHH